ncbi:hypothetical protein LK12_19360 [Novosphingobium malaysiense]|uniref:Uncharacterized protein n=1 Tax=Novosphingobium malaysiense TaxID=1348853 RepID=A0A0B1ZJ35_9SPHN|nr:hypothetical protein LK12_19360 [Novosphingobium malaysiense]
MEVLGRGRTEDPGSSYLRAFGNLQPCILAGGYGETPTYSQMRKQARRTLMLAMAVLRHQMEAGMRGIE